MNKKLSSYLVILNAVFSINLVSGQNVTGKQSDDSSQAKNISGTIFQWPDVKREYWPTNGWKISSMSKHPISSKKMLMADSVAKTDDSFRSLLVVKDGFVVFENYYFEGGRDKSIEIWSVTKSFTSALIGIAIDQGYIENIDKLMIDYLPNFPGFKDISIQHVLTHTTGLNWDEADQQSWIQSADWVSAALNRGFFAKPGETFLYSSANSHFLSKVIEKVTGKTPGEFAEKNLFNPLGIKFISSSRKELYSDWQELHSPIPNSWRQDNKGLEIGSFGLHLTSREMAKFGFLFLNQGNWDSNKIISTPWINESTKKHISVSENKGFGFHWIVSKRHGQLCIEADGWGGQMISIIPALDMIVVIKCDALNPRANNSYKVLELAIEAAVNQSQHHNTQN